jgi:rhamnose transport system substrate-binding protein
MASQPIAATSSGPPPAANRPSQQPFLLVILLAEIGVFSITGRNFFTGENAFEILRVSVEIGLLALALTPVIISGGIDLSVGSLMGLCAVVFGKLGLDPGLHSTIGFDPGLLGAIVATLGIGAAGGLLNGLLITRLRIPPLIVTLGSMSLFRGLAEGLTGGVQNFTIPVGNRFLLLGNGYIFGRIPAQVPVFLIALAGFWLMMHRTIIGRAIVAIGFSPEGARYAGIPVARRIRLVYLLCGLTAGVSSIIYVSHLGQAKSDAGTGYELLAITAVVLGGTSIFGGRGTVHGTLLGLLVISVLKNGLQLADLPSELAGIMTGVLLLITIIGSRTGHSERRRRDSRRSVADQPQLTEKRTVKNSQVAALSFVILLGALIVAGSNWWLVHSLKSESGGSSTAASDLSKPVSHVGADSAADPSKHKPITIAMMPKSKGNAYFIACQAGAEEAAKQLNVALLWDGPREPDPAKQNEIVETWMTRGVDVIAVACENGKGISTALRRARERGIKVITWDSDAEPDARDFFVNQATPEGIGQTLMDHANRVMKGEGEFAIITASLTATNMIEWQKQIELRRAAKYPQLKMAVLRPCDDKQDRAKQEATAIMNAYPNVKLIMAICSPAVPGAAEAVKQSGRSDVKVIGLGLPNDNKPYVHAGITQAVVLWNTMDLGYLTVYAADALARGTLRPGDKSFATPRLGKREIDGDNIILGTPFTFDKSNIDEFDF